FIVIFDLASEASFWQQKSRSSHSIGSIDRNNAEVIYKLLKPAADATQSLELQVSSNYQWEGSGDTEEFIGFLSETIESAVLDSLDDVWRMKNELDVAPYPEVRMRFLLEAITGWICRILISYLCSSNGYSETAAIWSRPFKQVRIQMSRAIQLCEQWEKSCLFFTQQLWASEASHRWEGEPPSLSYLQNFKNRLKEVLNLRGTYEQLVWVFSPQERERLGLSARMDDFLCKNLPTFSKVSADENNVFTGETSIGASQFFVEFQHFGELYKRPLIAKALQADREMIFGYIEAGVKNLREEFSRQPTEEPDIESASLNYVRHGRNIPNQVDRIVWASQLENRTREYLKLADSMLYDLANYDSLKEKLESLIKKVSKWCEDQFRAWCRLNQAAICRTSVSDGAEGAGGSLEFDASRTLLRLSTVDGHLHVGYPDGLVRLQREVRLLAGLGYPVPLQLNKVAALAETMYRHAIVLKQVAHFYNSIDSQMIPCQKALMLKSAMAFEHLIKFSHLKEKGDGKLPASKCQERCITWSQAEEVPIFISKLQALASNLMEENRRLRKIHYELISKIVSLMDVDLLRQQNKWRETLMTMRCCLSEIASSGGYPADHMGPWWAHLDRQLYKALEIQYLFGLETLNERMPEMRIELVYQQSQLSFQPPFEEIKSKYYREMRKFIAIPCHFRGVSDFGDSKSRTENSLIFSKIIENQSAGFYVCYQKAEFLFSRLRASMNQFQDWVALGNVDLEDLVDVQCREISDYESNFRALKRRGRAAEMLPNEIKIDCFTINCVFVKNSIEQLLQNLFDALVNCLRRSVQADYVAADTFLSGAVEKLSIRPQTVEEMAEAKDKHATLAKEQSRLADRLCCAEAKDKLLRDVVGAGVDSFAKTKAKWAKFQLMMESFKLMLNEQTGVCSQTSTPAFKIIKIFNLQPVPCML
uniref:DHC_N1 domain-containing protein n=1 Tax=Mesocestoides corti TaxID=53468 RepID=A0A5K3EFI2_MESCO